MKFFSLGCALVTRRSETVLYMRTPECAVAKKSRNRLRILKALAGTNWGQNKETLLITYKALIRSQFDYAAPVWYTNAKKTPVKRLQHIQNAGLRPVTGCHRPIASPVPNIFIRRRRNFPLTNIFRCYATTTHRATSSVPPLARGTRGKH